MFTDCLQTVQRHVYRLFKGMFTDSLQACLQTVQRHGYRLFTGMFTYCLQTVSGMKVLQFFCSDHLSLLNASMTNDFYAYIHYVFS